MDIRICIIGGGSKLWALTLMKDLATADELSGEVVLYDINWEAARINQNLGKQIFGNRKQGPNFTVRAEENLEDSLKGVDFVIISIEPGDISLRSVDLELPREYGILQTVGDTIGPGGISRAIRAIPVFRQFARSIMETCPNAWVINYTNPMTWCTTALLKEEPKIKVLGCCHEVFGTQTYLANKVADWFETEAPHHKDVEVDIVGVNHFTFAVGARWNGMDLFPKLKELTEDPDFFSDRTKIALERIKNVDWFKSDKRISLEFFRRFGNLGAAGDRHLAEFVPWFLKSERELHRYGVVATPYEWRVKDFAEKHSKKYTNEDLLPAKSDEEGVAIIRALLGLKPLYTNVNIGNVGQAPWLPKNHVIECNSYISQNSIVPGFVPIPAPAVESLISRVAEEQKILLEGVFEDDFNKVFQSFLMDPLMSLSVNKADELFSRILTGLGIARGA